MCERGHRGAFSPHFSFHSLQNIIWWWQAENFFLTVRISAFVSLVGGHPAAADLSAVQISQSGGALTGGQWNQTVSLCVTVCR